jgi:hypothetical protein
MREAAIQEKEKIAAKLEKIKKVLVHVQPQIAVFSSMM